MIRSTLSHAITDFNVVNNRICYITINALPFKFTIISAYAPTNEHDFSSKQGFYNSLQNTVANIPHSHYLILGMDANAKIGYHLPLNKTIGPFTTGTPCENGGLLRDFCISQHLAIVYTFF